MEDGELAECYRSGAKKLTPVVFSHGLTGSRTHYQMVFQEYASNGYIVFALDHLDGSCSYTRLKDGTPKHFDQSMPVPAKLQWDDYYKRI